MSDGDTIQHPVDTGGVDDYSFWHWYYFDY